VCCSVLQCVAVCCSVLQCVAVCCSVLQCVAVCCSMLQCVAVLQLMCDMRKSRILKCAGESHLESHFEIAEKSCLCVCVCRRVAVCCSVLQ